MSNETILREKVYIPSVSEYDAAREKYLAFMGAKLSEKARNDGAYEDDDYKAGYFFLRSPLSGYDGRVYYGNNDATRGRDSANATHAGLRFAFNLIYNPECDLVKGCRMESRKALVWNPENGGDEIVKSTAPIVKFGKYDCIWLNKEECEAAYAKGEKVAMQLWTLDLVAKAEPFAEKGDHNDYAKAKKLRAQCKRMFTKKELDQMVEVEMSSEDGYEKATPILETEETVAKDELAILFEKYLNAEINEQQFQETLISKVNEITNDPKTTEDDIHKFELQILEKQKWLNEKVAEREEQKAREAEAVARKSQAAERLITKIQAYKIGGNDEQE